MSSVLIRSVSRLLLTPTLIVALAVLVKGYAGTGDGFAAGVIAALGVAMQYIALEPEEVEARLPVRWAVPAAVAGLGVELLVAVRGLVVGDPLLTQAPGPGRDVVVAGTLELITAVAFDIGVFLLVLGTVVGVLRAVTRGRP